MTDSFDKYVEILSNLKLLGLTLFKKNSNKIRIINGELPLTISKSLQLSKV